MDKTITVNIKLKCREDNIDNSDIVDHIVNVVPDMFDGIGEAEVINYNNGQPHILVFNNH